MTNGKQVKTTLNPPLSDDMEGLCQYFGVSPSAILKMAVTRLARTELHHNKKTTSLESTKEAV